jgi:hypothetical protein
MGKSENTLKTNCHSLMMMHLRRLFYIYSISEIQKSWDQTIWNWGLIFNQFMAIFENRIQV